MNALRKGAMKPIDISDNEMAKSHGRYLVGGRSAVPNERVFRFEFPERPGALRKFLESLVPVGFNISLFHYRNQGGGASRAFVSQPSCSSADMHVISQTSARFSLACKSHQIKMPLSIRGCSRSPTRSSKRLTIRSTETF